MPPTYRKQLSNVTSTGYSWAAKAASMGGKTLWVVSTSALLLGVPWALAFSEEQQVQEMEREMRMQQSANEVRMPLALVMARSGISLTLAAAHTRCWPDQRKAGALEPLDVSIDHAFSRLPPPVAALYYILDSALAHVLLLSPVRFVCAYFPTLQRKWLCEH